MANSSAKRSDWWTSPGIHDINMVSEATPTAVSVDELGVHEADFEIVQHGWLVEVAERRQVVLAHQDVRVS